MLGGIFGQIFAPQYLAAFVVLGMGSVLAATTNTPVATTVLILEISHSFELMIPIAICICVSYLLAGGTSLYEGQKVTRDDEDPGFFARINVQPEDMSLGFFQDDANPADHDNSRNPGSEDESPPVG
jgi:hypothetical protein